MKVCYFPNTRTNSWRTEDEQMKISNTDGKEYYPLQLQRTQEYGTPCTSQSAYSQYTKFLKWRDFFLVLCNFSCDTFLLFAITQFLCNLSDICKLSTIIKVVLNFGLLAQENITSSIKPLFSLDVPTKNTLETN